jgi:hypothetical protein
MNDTRIAAVRVAAMKAIKDEASRLYDVARALVDGQLDPGDRKRAVLPTGEEVGTISKSDPKPRAVVDDDAVLLAWAKSEAPDEVLIETTIDVAAGGMLIIEWLRETHPHLLIESTVVRDSFVSALLGRVKQVDGMAIDTSTGEVVPGIGFKTGTPSVSVRQSDDQLRAFIDAWTDGHLPPELLGMFQPAELEPSNQEGHRS